jgi:hypothetical protein
MSNLLKAAAQWREAAKSVNTSYMKDVCEKTARALEIEHETGTPVCSCCHKVITVDDHGKRISYCDKGHSDE